MHGGRRSGRLSDSQNRKKKLRTARSQPTHGLAHEHRLTVSGEPFPPHIGMTAPLSPLDSSLAQLREELQEVDVTKLAPFTHAFFLHLAQQGGLSEQARVITLRIGQFCELLGRTLLPSDVTVLVGRVGTSSGRCGETTSAR